MRTHEMQLRLTLDTHSLAIRFRLFPGCGLTTMLFLARINLLLGGLQPVAENTSNGQRHPRCTRDCLQNTYLRIAAARSFPSPSSRLAPPVESFTNFADSCAACGSQSMCRPELDRARPKEAQDGIQHTEIASIWCGSDRTATSRGATPFFLFGSLASAPARVRIRAMSSLFEYIAQCRGFHPILLLALTSAPTLTSSEQASVWPFTAAKWSAVSVVFAVARSGSAPASRSSRMMSPLPRSEAL